MLAAESDPIDVATLVEVDDPQRLGALNLTLERRDPRRATVAEGGSYRCHSLPPADSRIPDMIVKSRFSNSGLPSNQSNAFKMDQALGSTAGGDEIDTG